MGTTVLAHKVPKYLKSRQQDNIFDRAGKVIAGYKRVKHHVARRAKRLPLIRSVASSRTARHALHNVKKFGGAATIALGIGDTQLIRSITKGDIPGIAESFVDAVRYLPEAASYVWNNPKDAANELFWEGLAVSVGESIFTLNENIDSDGYVYDLKRKKDAWIADSLGGFEVSYVDENGSPKVSFEEQEYIYSFAPHSDNLKSGRLIVYRPAEGLTEKRDENGEKIREILRVPVAEFEIVDGRVIEEIEYQGNDSRLVHTYDDSELIYPWLDKSCLTRFDNYQYTNEIFARYGMPETKWGKLYGAETATDILNSIQIGKRVSTTETWPKTNHAIIVDWDSSQDDQIIYTECAETTKTTNFYRPHLSDEVIREEITTNQATYSISYSELAKQGINVSGDKNDPQVRDRIKKELSEKIDLVRNLDSCRTIEPTHENTIQQYSYVVNSNKLEYGEGYNEFFRQHPLFGGRYGVYAKVEIDYSNNIVYNYDKQGNVLAKACYDMPNKSNGYRYALNNTFIPTDTKGIQMQFSASGKFLGFCSDEAIGNFAKLMRLQDEKALLSDFNLLKSEFGITTLPEIRREVEKLSETEDVSEWLAIVDLMERCDLESFNEEEIDKQIERCLAKNEEYEKQFEKLRGVYLKEDGNGNITISTKLHPSIQCHKIVETDENGEEYEIINLKEPNFVSGYIELDSSNNFSHTDFPATAESKNEFFTKSKQEEIYNFYRINYNGTAETQNYGGYVREDTLTGICHVYNRMGECVYVDVPKSDVKDDENWVSNPNSDKYKRIQNMVIESDRGCVYSDKDLFSDIENLRSAGLSYAYYAKLQEYGKMVKKPFMRQHNKWVDFNVELSFKHWVSKTPTDDSLREQIKCLSELEKMLSNVPEKTLKIKEEKEALAEQREILTRMLKTNKPERVSDMFALARSVYKQEKRLLSNERCIANINVNDYLSKKDKHITQTISICHHQKNQNQTVYRINSKEKKCLGIIIKDKKTGVCQIYDDGGNLMIVDRPLNDSWDEDLSPAVQNARYCDIIDQVNKRLDLYRYAYDPNQPSPELCANEDRYAYQQRLTKHEEYLQMQENLASLTDEALQTLNEDSGLIYFDQTKTLQQIEMPEILVQNDDSTYKNGSPTDTLNQAIADSSEHEENAGNEQNRSGLTTILHGAQKNTRVNIDTERVEEQINNSNQTAVASQSR